MRSTISGGRYPHSHSKEDQIDSAKCKDLEPKVSSGHGMMLAQAAIGLHHVHDEDGSVVCDGSLDLESTRFLSASRLRAAIETHASGHDTTAESSSSKSLTIRSRPWNMSPEKLCSKPHSRSV